MDDVLDEIGAAERPRLLALNKVDLLEDERRRELGFRYPRAVQVSAATGEGLEGLREAVEARFLATLRPMELLVPYDEGGSLSELHDVAGEMEREDTADGVLVRARVPVSAASRFERFALGGRGLERPRGMTLRFKRLSPAAVAPSKAHSDDAGYDLCAAEAAAPRPGRARERGDRASRWRSPTATRASFCRGRDWRPSTGSPS